MSVAVMVEIPGVTAAQYEAVIKEVFPGGHPPPGLQFHIAGPTDVGWRGGDMWDRKESFDRFAQFTLGPAMDRAGITERPIIETWPVHNAAHTH